MDQNTKSPGMDTLAELFSSQKALNMKIGVDTDTFTPEEQNEWLQKFSRALGQENAELLDSCHWKWWAKYQKLNLQNARVEIIDMFHFLISMAQTAGMTSEDVMRIYRQKLALNHKRQDSGYVKKDEDDNASIE